MAGRAVALLIAALALAGCGDPVVVLGDWPGTMRVVAGVPDSPGVRIDTLATRTLITEPYAVAVAGDATAYVADAAHGRIFEVASDGRLRAVVDHRTGCSIAPCLDRPAALAIDADGRVLIADVAGHRLFRLTPGSGALEVLAGTGTAGHSPDGAPAATSPIAGPAGVAIAADGTIHFTERDGHRLRAIDAAGNLVTVAGTGVEGTLGDGGPATAAQLSNPTAIVFGGPHLYFADTGRHRVRVIELATGTIGTIAGTGAAGFSGDAGSATAARLDRPLGLAVSDDGLSLYIADSNNHRVRIVTLPTLVIQTYAGTGSPIYTREGDAAGLTSLDRPAGLAFDVFGQLYVADVGHNVVWRAPVR